jgi:uncharacterized damage-inducible protein DinB
MMDLLRELLRYHAWATLQLIDNCLSQPSAAMQQIVTGTNRSVLHTLTHLVGSDQSYLERLTGKPVDDPVRRGEILSLTDLRQRCENQARHWELVLGRLAEVEVTIPADEEIPEIPHGENLLVMQAIEHGIDHRTQICTALSVSSLKPPDIDVWSYWAAVNPSGV